MSAPSSEEGSGSPAEPRSLAVSLLRSISWESWLRVATCSARPLAAPCGIYVCWSQKRRSLAELRSLIVASRSLSCSYAASCLLFILRQMSANNEFVKVLRENQGVLGLLQGRASEKNSSRKLADQARLPTPRYHIGIRVYAGEFGEEPLSQVR